ncbi:MAG: hypothetical protein DMG01_16335, partial [Acidobacteria bacterium]
HYEQALALAERSVSLHKAHGSGHGLAVALATLGQICVRLGDLARAEEALHRALDVRSPIQFHETTGAVFDTLAQIHLIRGRYDTASDFLGRASDAYGAYGRQTSQWYQWSVRVLGARLALRRGALGEAVALADEIEHAAAPPLDALQATLIAAEALIAAGRNADAEHRLAAAADGLDPKSAPAAWGEYLRLRGLLHAQTGSPADAYHDFAQSATLLPPRARTARRGNGRPFGCRTPLAQGTWHLRAARRGARSHGHARCRSAAHQRRYGAVRHLASRRRRCDRAAHRRCGCASRTARTRNGGGAARGRGGRFQRRLRGAPGRRRADRRLGRIRRRHRQRAGALRRARKCVRTRHDGRRAARPRRRRRPLRPGRVAAPARPSRDAPPADDCRRRATGIRAVRRARTFGGAGRHRARPLARAAAARLSLCQRRDDARRRTDPAAAGERADGADHGRERHG